MKTICCTLIAVVFLVSTSIAQQPDSSKPQAAKKPAAVQSGEKPAETAAKPESPAEEKAAPRETAADREKDKEERYDMTEAAPVVTHHQITVDGKPLKYTATAGRLPIKRGDGKTEAEMFYVAYTLMLMSAGVVSLVASIAVQNIITIFVQVVAVTLLPAALMFLILLLNDKPLMGEYVNTRWQNIANWSIAAFVIVISTAYGISVLFPEWFGSGT